LSLTQYIYLFRADSYIVCLFILSSLTFLSRSSSRSVSHHGHELVEINLSISILVDFGDSLVKLLLGVHVSEVFTGEELEQLVGIDLTAAVRVEHLEGCLEVGLSLEHLSVHRGG